MSTTSKSKETTVVERDLIRVVISMSDLAAGLAVIYVHGEIH